MRLWMVLFILSLLLVVPVSANYAVWVADSYRGVAKFFVDDTGVQYLGRNMDVRRPYAVAVDTDGRVWVADLASQTLHRLDPSSMDEEFVMEGFSAVTKIAIDPLDDSAIVIDQGRNEVARVTPDAIVLWKTELSFPLSVDVNPVNGDIWIGGRDKIYQLDQAGTVVQEFRGMVNRAEDIQVDPVTGEIWIANVWHSEILRLAPDGKVLSRTPVRSPKQIALNIPFGGIAVLDQLNRQVHFIDERGVLFKTISEGIDYPHAIAIDPQQGHLWLATSTNDRGTLKRYTVDGGVMVHNMAGFFYPRDIAFDFSKNSAVSNTYFPTVKDLSRPQIPSRVSTPLFEPVTITESDTGGDKGVLRSSLREYMRSPANLAVFKAYDYRINPYPLHTPQDSVSAALFNYCQQLLSRGREPFRYSPYQQLVRSPVFMAECASRYEALGFYAGFLPYEEPFIDLRTLSPIPSVQEMQKQSVAPYQGG